MSVEKLVGKTDVVKYIIEQKNLGKDKEAIFDDLIDNKGVNKVFARSTLESIRWES